MNDLEWLLQNGWIVVGYDWFDASTTSEYFDWRREDRRTDISLHLAKVNGLDTMTLNLKWLEEPVAHEIVRKVHTGRML